MFERLLIPLDGSSLAECTIPHAIAIANVFGSEITFLRIADETQNQLESHPIDPVSWQIDKREAGAYLDSILERLKQTSLPMKTALLEGHAAERIVEFAIEHGTDLMILSSHGHSGLSGWNISSVAQKILLRPPCSTMIVRAYRPAYPIAREIQYGSVLMPLDGSLRAEVVLPVATTIAQHYEARLIALHVVTQPEMPSLTPLVDEDAALSNRVVERNLTEGTRYIEQLRSRVPVDLDTRLAQYSSVTSYIDDFAEREAVDLIILSAHGYTGRTTRPYGSVVTNLIAYGTTPILIVQDARQEITVPGQDISTRRPEGRPDAQF